MPRAEKAEKTEKTEKPSADKAADMILQYLRKQNRPYSATDISSNLHNKVTKTATAKTLKELQERGYVQGRTHGGPIPPSFGSGSGSGDMCLLLSTNNVKHRETSRLPCQSGTRRITCNPRNTSYQLPEMPILSDEDVWSQGPEDAGTPEQLAVLDSEIEGLKRDTATAKADYKALVATLATLQTTLTTTDLRESVHALELSKKELLGRLLPLRVGNVSPVSPSEKDSVEQEWRKARMDAFTRKKIFDDFWALLYDNAPDGLVMEELAILLTTD
ncbi:MAG: hypothetical protein M1815_006144 [Lichina confinis]|nr:MAG: hypothetical protein M1815_006144 [Lichina confinis]